MSDRIFVIGDVHGCSKTFTTLLDDVCKINKSDAVYLLGDYIDRGPGSKGVVDKILEMQSSGYDVKAIRGNHEEMLLGALRSTDMFLAWQHNGCEATLKSFGVKGPKALDQKYIDFFEHLPYYYLLDDYIIVHGGLNFNIDDPLEDTYSMVWERNKELEPGKIGGRKMIVGHTPVPLQDVRSSLDSGKIMLDGGCVYHGRYYGIGYLCALELNSMELLYQENIEDEKIYRGLSK